MSRELSASFLDMCLIDAIYGTPTPVVGSLFVRVRNFSLMDHPGMGSRHTVNVAEGEFIFQNVASSIRHTREYLNDPRGTATPENPLGDSQEWGEIEESIDIEGPRTVTEAGNTYREFFIENGMMAGPPEAGLCDWKIVAQSATVRIIREKNQRD